MARLHSPVQWPLDLCNGQVLREGTGPSFWDGITKNGAGNSPEVASSPLEIKKVVLQVLGRCFSSDLMAVFGTGLFHPSANFSTRQLHLSSHSPRSSIGSNDSSTACKRSVSAHGRQEGAVTAVTACGAGPAAMPALVPPVPGNVPARDPGLPGPAVAGSYPAGSAPARGCSRAPRSRAGTRWRP